MDAFEIRETIEKQLRLLADRSQLMARSEHEDMVALSRMMLDLAKWLLNSSEEKAANEERSGCGTDTDQRAAGR